MAQVLFSFKPGVPEARRAEVLAEMHHEDGVLRAAVLKPDARHEILRRHCYALVEDDAAADRLVAALRQRNEIESVELPPRRRLASGQ
jgi:hypothetical protein